MNDSDMLKESYTKHTGRKAPLLGIVRDRSNGNSANRLGDADLTCQGLWPLLHAARAALSNQKQSHSLQEISGRIHSLRQKDIRLRVVVIDTDFTGDQNGGRLRRHVLDLGDQLGTIEP